MTQPDDANISQDSVEEGTTDRRKLAAAGIAAAVVLAGGGFFLLSGGSEDPAPAPIVSGKKVGPAPAPVAKNGAVLPPVSSIKLGRNPFRPLYVVPVAAPAAAPAAAGGTTTTGGTTTGGTTTTVGTGTTTTGTTGTTPKPTTAPKPKAPATYALRLASVDGGGSNLTAKFLIGADKKIQYARAGSVFGRHLEIRLLSIQKGAKGAGTAVIQVGDGSPFDVSTADGTIYVL